MPNKTSTITNATFIIPVFNYRDGPFPSLIKHFHMSVKKNSINVINYNFFNTVESLLTDTPNKGHCIKYLFTMDKIKSPNCNPPINIMQLESLNRGQSLYSGQTT